MPYLRCISFLFTFLGCLAVSVQASTLYTTTDLGSNYTLQANASGQDYGVANSNGNVVYAFDKLPATTINLRTDFPDGSSQVLTMQDGTHQVGYINNYIYQVGPIVYSTSVGPNSGWFLQPGVLYLTANFSPVSDINSQGQVVGTSQYSPGQMNTYAAFSNVNGLTHNYSDPSSVVDNLNHYIATISGVTLTSAVKIDDLGRILAVGSSGDDYLLTPVALGSAATVPEPSAAWILGLAGSFVGLRSISRRWSR